MTIFQSYNTPLKNLTHAVKNIYFFKRESLKHIIGHEEDIHIDKDPIDTKIFL